MSVSESQLKEIAAMPAVLRTLLEAELAAGNGIAEVGHAFPAPPVGAYFKLTKPLLTRPRKSGEGIDYYDRNNFDYSGEITDSKKFYFLLEPPRPPEVQLSMDAIRAARAPMNQNIDRIDPVESASAPSRFRASMVTDFDKWHDGLGYDLDALRAMSPAEKESTEAVLLARGAQDWRDIEALACLDTPAARELLKAAINHRNPEVRNAVTRCAPELIPNSERTASLVRGLETANFYGGLSQTLDHVAEFHPPLIVEALFRGVLDRAGEVAVHFAAMLTYIYGQATEPFDMEQRPFFLRFNTDDHTEREAVFDELCRRIGVDPDNYPGSAGFPPPSSVTDVIPDHTVEVDCRGEMLTYCELNRSAHVICTFGGVPQIVPRTLSNWNYPLGRRSEKMNDEEKAVILTRIADYCRKHHRMTAITFEA